MGRYDLSAHNVHLHAARMLKRGKKEAHPPWFHVIGTIPPAQILTRPPMQKKASKSRRSSKIFKPLNITPVEDKLRWEFFNDHPWELARPRVVLENDGLDHTRWEWGHALCRPVAAANDAAAKQRVLDWDRQHITQASRPLNGEAVVQRQQWLMHNENISEPAAYDKARKEFYRARHRQEIEQKVAKEEALFYGGIFGMSAIEVGMQLEDKAFEDFRTSAIERIAARKQSQMPTMIEEEELQDIVEDETAV